MKLERLEIFNFLSICTAKLTFPAGVHFIHGINFDMSADGAESNGSGKSSLADAILWVLFGVINRGKVKEDDVINRAAGKNCRVEIVFSHAGNVFRIKRYRKDDEEKGSGVRWWENGEEKTSHGSKDTQKDLEGRLPVSLHVFRHGVLVGQGMPDRFLDLSETDKQQLLGEIVDLTNYDHALERVKDQISSQTTQLAVARGNVESVRGQINRMRQDLEMNEKALISYRNLVAPDQGVVQEEIKKLDKDSAFLQTGKVNLETSLPRLAEELSVVSQQMPEFQAARDRAVRAVSECRARVNSFQEEQNRLSATPKVCPTCKRPMDGRDGLIERMVEVAIQQDAAIQNLKLLTVDEVATVHTLRVISDDVNKVRALITQAESQIRGMNENLLGNARKRNEAERRQSEYLGMTARYQNKVDIIKDNLTKLEDGLLPQEDRVKELDTSLRHWEFWRTAIPNLRAAAMEEVLGYLNERLTFYMDIFSGGAMGVRLFQEAYGKGSKIRVELKTPAGTYDLSSGGEKRRVDLALYLSLSDLLQTTSGMACNLLIADEISDGLSPTGVKQFLDVLKVLAQAGRCVFVMSHNSAVANQFDFDSVKVVERREGKAILCVT